MPRLDAIIVDAYVWLARSTGLGWHLHDRRGDVDGVAGALCRFAISRVVRGDGASLYVTAPASTSTWRPITSARCWRLRVPTLIRPRDAGAWPPMSDGSASRRRTARRIERALRHAYGTRAGSVQATQLAFTPGGAARRRSTQQVPRSTSRPNGGVPPDLGHVRSVETPRFRGSATPCSRSV
jgi:hypothetical protein